MDKSPIFGRYFNLSLRFLSYRPRSEQEVYKYLKEKAKRVPELDEKTIATIMQRLIELKFIDDTEFTKFWLEHRKKAFRILKQELLQKGVSKEVIDSVASTIQIQDNENELIDRLINKKQNLTYEKLIAFLMRRGFSYEDVKKKVKRP